MKSFISLPQQQEGEVLLNWFKIRFSQNKNILILTIGSTGSGKSWADARICELWYKAYFNKAFPVEHICFSLEEAVKLIFSGKLKRGDIIIIEEAGININALDFQKKAIKFFGFILQSFRSKNIGIIFNTPNLSFIGKTQRTLLHGVLETAGIDRKNSQVILKPYYLQTNSFYGKTYKKFLRKKVDNRLRSIERIALSKPSDELITAYEEKKSIFVEKIGKEFISLSETKDEEEKPFDEEFYKKYKMLRLDRGMKNTKIQEELCMNPRTIQPYIKRLREEKLNTLIMPLPLQK